MSRSDAIVHPPADDLILNSSWLYLRGEHIRHACGALLSTFCCFELQFVLALESDLSKTWNLVKRPVSVVYFAFDVCLICLLQASGCRLKRLAFWSLKSVKFLSFLSAAETHSPGLIAIHLMSACCPCNVFCLIWSDLRYMFPEMHYSAAFLKGVM